MAMTAMSSGPRCASEGVARASEPVECRAGHAVLPEWVNSVAKSSIPSPARERYFSGDSKLSGDANLSKWVYLNTCQAKLHYRTSILSLFLWILFQLRS